MEFLDPTHEHAVARSGVAPRLASLAGATVGVISNGKESTGPFFDHVADELVERFKVARVVRTVKSNYSAPADDALMAETVGWDAVLSGVGD